jgi:hypothetical protein
MHTLCERMPQEAKDELPPSIMIFAPSDNLENRPQWQVNATVIHEIAHAILDHDGGVPRGDEYRHKREADMLIQEWGYRATNSCGWMRKEKALATRNAADEQRAGCKPLLFCRRMTLAMA